MFFKKGISILAAVAILATATVSSFARDRHFGGSRGGNGAYHTLPPTPGAYRTLHHREQRYYKRRYHRQPPVIYRERTVIKKYHRPHYRHHQPVIVQKDNSGAMVFGTLAAILGVAIVGDMMNKRQSGDISNLTARQSAGTLPLTAPQPTPRPGMGSGEVGVSALGTPACPGAIVINGTTYCPAN